MRSLLLLLACLNLAHAAQPTLTSVTTLPGGTEETPYVITYATVLAASNASGNTTRFKVTSLAQGTLASRAHGSSNAWVAVASLPILLDGSTDLQWTPAANAYGDRSSIRIRANNGGDPALDANNSDSDITVGVHLAATPDFPTAQSGVNARSGTVGPFTPPVVAATEDTWNEFTYANLTALLQAVDVDDSAFEFVITTLGDGTLAKSSGGAALAVGDTIATGESLWWRPSANRFTWPGATPADDEAPATVMSCTVRKVADHAYVSAAVTLTSSIAGVSDPFDTNVTGAQTFTLVRGGAPLTLTVPAMIAKLNGHTNVDRVDAVGMKALDLRFPVSAYYPNGDYHHTGTFTATYDETIRLTVDPSVAAGTYTIGTWQACSTAGIDVDPHTADVDLVIRVVESGGGGGGGAGGGGGGGGGCGAGAGAAASMLLLVAASGLFRRNRRRQ